MSQITRVPGITPHYLTILMKELIQTKRSTAATTSIPSSSASSGLLDVGSHSILSCTRRYAFRNDIHLNNIHTAIRAREGGVRPRSSLQFHNSAIRYRKLATSYGHFDAVYCVITDKTGTRVFTGADDCLVKMWEVRNGSILQQL